MKVLKYNVLIVALFLLCYNSFLYPYNVIIKDCNQETIRPSDYPIAKEVMNAFKDALKGAEEKLPKSCFKLISDKLDEKPLLIYIECRMERQACGQTTQYFKNRNMLWSIHLSYQNNWGGDGCGCLKSVILHELLHWGAELREGDEISAYSCQLKCFPECTIIPKEYAEASPDKCCCEK